MSFYQRIFLIITVAVMVVTGMILFICFEQPHSDKFILEAVAILLAEVFCGISCIAVSGKNDNILFFSVGYNQCAFLYLAFTLLMAFFVKAQDIQLKNFIVFHIAGLVLFFIRTLFFLMGEHNMEEQCIVDNCVKKQLSNFQRASLELEVEAKSAFADAPDLNEALRNITEEFRYAADSSEKTMELDSEITAAFQTLNQALRDKNNENFQAGLTSLEKLLEKRKHVR